MNDVCDKIMLNELDGIMNPTLRERIDKSIVRELIKANVHFGLGHPVKKIKNLLMNLQKSSVNQSLENFQRTRVNVNGIDEIWAADLIDMQTFSTNNN